MILSGWVPGPFLQGCLFCRHEMGPSGAALTPRFMQRGQAGHARSREGPVTWRPFAERSEGSRPSEEPAPWSGRSLAGSLFQQCTAREETPQTKQQSSRVGDVWAKDHRPAFRGLPEDPERGGKHSKTGLEAAHGQRSETGHTVSWLTEPRSARSLETCPWPPPPTTWVLTSAAPLPICPWCVGSHVPLESALGPWSLPGDPGPCPNLLSWVASPDHCSL